MSLSPLVELEHLGSKFLIAIGVAKGSDERSTMLFLKKLNDALTAVITEYNKSTENGVGLETAELKIDVGKIPSDPLQDLNRFPTKAAVEKLVASLKSNPDKKIKSDVRRLVILFVLFENRDYNRVGKIYNSVLALGIEATQASINADLSKYSGAPFEFVQNGDRGEYKLSETGSTKLSRLWNALLIESPEK